MLTGRSGKGVLDGRPLRKKKTTASRAPTPSDTRDLKENRDGGNHELES